MAYAAAIVIGGSAVGLLVYLLVTTTPPSGYAHVYGQGSNQGYYNRRTFDTAHKVQEGFNFDLLGLVSKAMNVYQKINEED